MSINKLIDVRFWAIVLVGLFSLSACGQPEQAVQAEEPAAAAETVASEGAQEEVAAAEPTADTETDAALPGGGPEVITELQITDVKAGDGATAETGQNVIVHYTGWLYDPSEPENKGEKFDSSVDRGQPFVFSLGAGRVIQGWDQGVDGMQVGGQRVLTIPAHMGYGDRGAGAAIPPNATLLFEVELLGFE
jgi:FKBP-type peptidyl-prolyl cis-trans isomerase FkpA